MNAIVDLTTGEVLEEHVKTTEELKEQMAQDIGALIFVIIGAIVGIVAFGMFVHAVFSLSWQWFVISIPVAITGRAIWRGALSWTDNNEAKQFDNTDED